MTRPLNRRHRSTNASLALVTPNAFEPYNILSQPCADYPGLVEAVQDHLA